MSTVVVGCKVPNGIILGDDAVAFGNARVESGQKQPAPIAHGYALTEVNEDIWNAWLKRNANSAIVQRHLIFAEHGWGNARNKARELARTSGSSGMGPTSGSMTLGDPNKSHDFTNRRQ